MGSHSHDFCPIGQMHISVGSLPVHYPLFILCFGEESLQTQLALPLLRPWVCSSNLERERQLDRT